MLVVVNPSRPRFSARAALCDVYPVIPTPETRGHVCQISSLHSIVKASQPLTLQYYGKKAKPLHIY
jgi:hypothetical protein